MKTLSRQILFAVTLAVCALSAAASDASSTEKKIRPIVPSLAESADYWRQALIIFDAKVAGGGLRVLCGKVPIYGRYDVLCVRAERGQKTIQDLYYTSEESDSPVLREEKDRVIVAMPSGFHLLEIKKKPNQLPEPTSGIVTPGAAAPVAPIPPVAHR